jgi:predicted phage tail protein
LATPYGTIDSADVQAAINMSLGILPCTANIAGSGVCNVVVVQRVINAMPAPTGTGTCLTGTGAIAHSVSLSWAASTTSNVTYNVYRATTSGGYSSTPIASAITGTTYTDTTVQAGTTYFYVTKAVDSSGNLSAASNEAQAPVAST